jgi:hypothetical protein
MTSKEALKRLKQETAPATYMADFDKEKCIEIIKKDLDRLEKENIKLKQAIKVLKEKGLIFTSGESGRENCICLCDYGYGVSLTQEEYELLKEVLGDE